MGPPFTHGSRAFGSSVRRFIGRPIALIPGPWPRTQDVDMSVKALRIGPEMSCPSRSASARYCPRYEDAERYFPYFSTAATLTIFSIVGGNGICFHWSSAFRRNLRLDLTPAIELAAYVSFKTAATAAARAAAVLRMGNLPLVLTSLPGASFLSGAQPVFEDEDWLPPILGAMCGREGLWGEDGGRDLSTQVAPRSADWSLPTHAHTRTHPQQHLPTETFFLRTMELATLELATGRRSLRGYAAIP